MAELIHREVSSSGVVTHVYSNGDVWEFTTDALATCTFRRTRGYKSRLFPTEEYVRLWGYPDGWKAGYEPNGSCRKCGVHFAYHIEPCKP